MATAETVDQHAVMCIIRLSDTASLLVEVNITAADWLVRRGLQESYELVISAFKIQM